MPMSRPSTTHGPVAASRRCEGARSRTSGWADARSAERISGLRIDWVTTCSPKKYLFLGQRSRRLCIGVVTTLAAAGRGCRG